VQNRSVFPALIGNDRLKNILFGDILAGKMGHAYILEGPVGSGKHTLAKSMASAASCLNRTDSSTSLPCGECIVCKKIARDVSPDLIFVRRESGKATIGIERIRDMREDLYIAPNENERKFYIFEDAETMTVQAQNALLLSLEEPPPYVTFVLLTTDASALLETIRSRAPILRMEHFDAQKLASALKSERKYSVLAEREPAFFAEAITASGGAIGAAKKFLDRESEESAELLELHTLASSVVSLLFRSAAAESADTLQKLPKSRESILGILHLVSLALRDLVAVKKRSCAPLSFYLTQSECSPITEKVGISRIHAAYLAVEAAYMNIQSNASVTTTFTSLLMNKF